MVRDVQQYYKQVTNQYILMKSELQDMEDLCKEKMVSPEQIENMKKMVEPIKLNYETLSYFMFLLNRPAKKKKIPTYEKQNKKILEASNNRKSQDIINENQEALNNIKNLKEEVKNYD